MIVLINSRADLTLEHFRRVACEGEGVAIGPGARHAMAAARRSFARLAEADPNPAVSWSSGSRGAAPSGGVAAEEPGGPDRAAPAGAPAGQRASPATAETPTGQPAPPAMPGHLHSAGAAGAGVLPERVVRGLVFARLADVVEGHTACRPEAAEMLAALLDGPMPRIPLDGLVAAGEPIALGHLVSLLPADGLDDGERGALLGGAPCSAALAADVAVLARHRLELAAAVFALSVEAMNAPLDAYLPALRAMWGDRFITEVLGMLSRWLAGARTDRRPYQAPVSYRVMPQVLGVAARAVAEMEDVARISLSCVTADPVYLPPSGEHPLGVILRNGGAHNAIAYPALNTLSAVWADLCTLADRHTAKLHRYSPSRAPGRRTAPRDGAFPPASCLGLAQAAAGERARHAAARTHLPPSEGHAVDGQDDVVLPVFLAYERHLVTVTELDRALAVLAIAASQELDIADREPAEALRPLAGLVREHALSRQDVLGHRHGAPFERVAEALSAMAGGGLRPRDLVP